MRTLNAYKDSVVHTPGEVMRITSWATIDIRGWDSKKLIDAYSRMLSHAEQLAEDEISEFACKVRGGSRVLAQARVPI